MTTVSAKKRETRTTGDINKLRLDGLIPGILYGGSKQNQKISKIKVVSISSIMAEAIKRISNSTSVSSLFK